MRKVERREVVKKTVEKVTVGRYCDNCGEEICAVEKIGGRNVYNYFLVSTHHNDWGNDSIDSYESYDACCPSCAVKLAGRYLEVAYEGNNTKEINIAHARDIEDGTDSEYLRDIVMNA